MSPKTIFITSFHPHISRNILSTDVLRLLKGWRDLRIVILVPDYKINYFKESFAGGNIIFEGVKLYQFAKTKLGAFFKKMEVLFWDTKTARFKKRYEFYYDRKWLKFLFAFAAGFLSHSFILRRLVRYLDFKLSPKGIFSPLIEKYSPDLIFSTDVQNGNDVILIQEAKKEGVPILGMIRSWDNPTQRFLRVWPDKFLVGSEAIKDEVLKLYRYPEDKIIITGHPHYDCYADGPTVTREEFFAQFGFDPQRRLILFTPVGDKFYKDNDADQYIMEMLGEVGAQVLVRFHPDVPVKLVNFSKPKNMVFDQPGIVFKDEKFDDREIGPDDDARLRNSIYYSDLVVGGPTSVCLDAAFLNKPVVVVNMYPTQRDIFETCWAYQCSHVKNLLKTNGVRYVTTRDDFLKIINEYLKNPALDEEGRKKICSQWFSHADGRASQRVVSAISQMP